VEDLWELYRSSLGSRLWRIYGSIVGVLHLSVTYGTIREVVCMNEDDLWDLRSFREALCTVLVLWAHRGSSLGYLFV
jgi:hypothetical protein